MTRMSSRDSSMRIYGVGVVEDDVVDVGVEVALFVAGDGDVFFAPGQSVPVVVAAFGGRAFDDVERGVLLRGS